MSYYTAGRVPLGDHTLKRIERSDVPEAVYIIGLVKTKIKIGPNSR